MATLDLTPLAIAASAALVAIGLWRLQMFDVFPALVVAAHDTLMGDLRDGVLVIDGHDRVLEANRAAGSCWRRSPPRWSAGRWSIFSPVRPLLTGRCQTWNAAEQGSFETTVLAANGSQRHLEITVSRQGSSPRADGHVLVLHDVSERVATIEVLRESSQRLRVLSSSLRSAS